MHLFSEESYSLVAFMNRGVPLVTPYRGVRPPHLTEESVLVTLQSVVRLVCFEESVLACILLTEVVRSRWPFSE